MHQEDDSLPSPSSAAVREITTALEGLSTVEVQSHTQLRLLREEKAELEARVSALEHDVRELPTLERDLLFQADRADVLESALESLTARYRSLQVLAHGRARGQNLNAAAAIVRCVLTSLQLRRLASALRIWRELPTSGFAARRPDDMGLSTPQSHQGASTYARATSASWKPPMLAAAGAAELTTLQYQNLLLQRAAAQQARQARYDCGAALVCAFQRREHNWVLGIYWRLWSRFAWTAVATAPCATACASTITPWHVSAPPTLAQFSTPRLLPSFTHPTVQLPCHRTTIDSTQ